VNITENEYKRNISTKKKRKEKEKEKEKEKKQEKERKKKKKKKKQTNPRPLSRGVKNIRLLAGLGEEVVRKFDAWKVAEQHAMCVHAALRVS
jgi:hypothetical protein